MADKTYQIAFAGEAVSNEFYGDVVSLSVEENTSTAGSFLLRLAIRRQDDGSWTYLADDRFAVFTEVSIRVGFTGGGGLAGALGGQSGGDDGLAPVFDGYVAAVDVAMDGERGSSYLDVAGIDASILLGLEEKVATWPNLADDAIVSQIVSGYGLPVKAESTTIIHKENDTTVVQRSSDLQFIRALARRNGFEFYFETDKSGGQSTAYFRPPQLGGTPQPDLAMQFGEASNLRRFHARLSGQRPLNVKAAQIDVKSNGVNSGQAADTQLTKLGAKDLVAVAGGTLDSLVTPKEAQAQMLLLAPASDAGELKTIAQAVRDEAGWLITASGEVNAEAYQAVLRPHRLVLVKGAGTAFSGKYYITRVVHEIKGDGSYVQRFEARRNARDVDGSESFGSSNLGLPTPGG